MAPLKVQVGWSRKVGQPEFGSVGASCSVELAIDDAMADPVAARRRVQEAFDRCRSLVEEQLVRRAEAAGGGAAPNPERSRDVDAAPLRPARSSPANDSPRATANQLRALAAIAGRRRIDLDGLIGERFGVEQMGSLTRRQASRLIDELDGARAAG